METTQESLPVVKPKSSTDVPEVVVREGADELTVRRREGMLRAFIDTTNVGDSRWRPPLVDEDGDAICQAIYKGVEGPDWEVMHNKYVETHKAVNLKQPRINKKASCGHSATPKKRGRPL